MVQVGDRVKVTGIMPGMDPVPVGAEGTVNWVSETGAIGGRWDNGQGMILLTTDPYVVLPRYQLPDTDEVEAHKGGAL